MDKQGKTKPSLKPRVIDGQLVHYVAVGGKPIQGHTSLKAALCAVSLAIALQGCATIERHPVATAVVAGIVAGSIAASKSERSALPGQDLCTPPLSCK